MSPPGPEGPLPLDSHENLRAVMDEFAAGLVQVLETMTDQRPEVHWQAVSGTPADAGAGAEADVLWWEQPFQFAPDAEVWVASPRASWEYAGTLTLKASGLETVPDGEVQKTWLEILGQWLSGLARSVGSVLGREVTCAAGAERAPAEDRAAWAAVSVAFGETVLAPLAVTFSAPLVALLTAKSPPDVPEVQPGPEGRSEPMDEPLLQKTPRPSRTMDLLLDVDLPVSISFGKTQLPLKDVLKLTTGSIVELNRGVNEPVEVLVNHCLVARGEVVVVDGNYGIRIQQIVSRQDRLRSLR
ncbi:MAG: flagellar motor switch protein FliN [Acidobacteriia bacterium]|nr:flagellar motor switch protein FliN [Terriglobia bacterium]